MRSRSYRQGQRFAENHPLAASIIFTPITGAFTALMIYLLITVEGFGGKVICFLFACLGLYRFIACLLTLIREIKDLCAENKKRNDEKDMSEQNEPLSSEPEKQATAWEEDTFGISDDILRKNTAGRSSALNRAQDDSTESKANRKRTVIWILVIIGIIVLIVVGISAKENRSKREAESYHSKMAEVIDPYGKSEYASGSKVVVYDADQSAFCRKYVSEELLANDPEEVGYVLEYHHDGQNNLGVFRLIDHMTGIEIASAQHQPGAVYADLSTWIENKFPQAEYHRLMCTSIDPFEASDNVVGTKVVAYFEDSGLFSDQFIPKQLKADDPENARFVLVISSEYEKNTKKYAVNPYVIDRKTGKQINIDERELNANINDHWKSYDDTDTKEYYSESVIGDWLTGVMPLKEISISVDPYTKADNVTGNKVIAYFEDTQDFTERYVSERYRAAFSDEVRFVLILHSHMDTVEERYGISDTLFSTITGKLETLSVQLFDRKTGKVIAEKAFHTQTPDRISMSAKTFTQTVPEEDVIRWTESTIEYRVKD